MNNNPSNEASKLREKLAAIEHERWADWQAWCHKVINEHGNPSPETFDVMQRWERQIATKYADLSDVEKASDMEQVDRYWHLIEAYITQKAQELLQRVEDEQIPVVALTAKTHEEVQIQAVPIEDIKRIRTSIEKGE